ncbi:MAG TPA: type IV pilin protein [Burkholderiales bacterium]|nr:type IV pilin protein [Burkholderiales bacterium]
MRATKGFTLIELITVVGIVAIISVVAIPSYTEYSTRGKIAEATSALSDGRIKMEQFFQDNRTYVGGPTPTATQYFTYSVSGTSTTTYVISAIGNTTGNTSMNGWTMTIDQTNTKRTTAAPAGWAAAVMPTSCWITKKNGLCL